MGFRPTKFWLGQWMRYRFVFPGARITAFGWLRIKSEYVR